MAKPIAQDLWRTEIERIMQGAGDEGLTLREIAAAIGRSTRATRERLQALGSAGRIAAGRRRVVGLDGVTRPVPVYRIVSGKA